MIRRGAGLRGIWWGLSSGSTVTPSPTSAAANRFDLIFSLSTVAPGSAVTWSLIPNGSWIGGGNIVLTPSNGDPAITQAVPSSGSAVLTGSYTPSAAGEVSLAATNTAGLLNPYPAPLTVFAGASGAAATITASLASTDQARLQRDTASGAPTGFTGSWIKGWGEVRFTLGQSGAGLFVRLYDASSSGATSSVGTGTALTSIVQVHGAFSAGTVRALLPAGPYIYYADVATDAAFTNPVRIAQRFGVGYVVAIMSRSQECGFVVYYADTTAFTPIYSKLSTWTASDYRYPADSYSGIVWGIDTATSAGEEFARILEAQFGVVVGITGVAATGGGMDEFFAHDGTPSSAFSGTVGTSVGNKFRTLILNMGGWDGVDSTNYPSETWVEDQARMQAAVVKIPQLYPSCAAIRWCTGASGWFGSDGSRDLGYTRVTGIIRALEASNPMVVGGESTLWNEYQTGHATQGARPDYARTAARMVLAVDPLGGIGAASRGPTLAATGTLVGRILRIPYTLHGGTTLTTIGASYSNPSVTYNTASPAELASLFAVYAGASGRQGTGTAIRIDTATINIGAGTIDLALTGTSGVTYADASTGSLPSAFNVHYGADYGASNGTVTPGNARGVSLCDDVSEFSIPYGRLMRPALDIAVS